MAHGPRHALALKRLERLLRGVETFGYHLHIQLPVTLSAVQEPEPDLAVVRGTPEDYQNRHPGPGEIFAVVEVSDSTLDYDRTTKQRIYATAGLPRYWIVNLPENRIDVYEQPAAGEGRYSSVENLSTKQIVRLSFSSAALIDVPVRQVLLFDSEK